MKNALIKFYGSNLTNHMPTAVPCMGLTDGSYIANFDDVIDWVSGCELSVVLLCEMSTNDCIKLNDINSFDLLYDLSENYELDFIIDSLDSLDVVDGQVYSFAEVVNYLDHYITHGSGKQGAIQCATNILKGILNGTIEVKSL